MTHILLHDDLIIPTDNTELWTQWTGRNGTKVSCLVQGERFCTRIEGHIHAVAYPNVSVQSGTNYVSFDFTDASLALLVWKEDNKVSSEYLVRVNV